MTIALLDRALDEELGANFDEFLFRIELEELGQRVETIHCNKNHPPRFRACGSSTYIEYDGYEINASETLRGDKHRKHGPFLSEALQKRMDNPKPGLEVIKRGEDFYLVYPPVRRNISHVKGVACLASNIGVESSSDIALDILGRFEKAGAVPLNSKKSIEISNSKIHSHAAFEAHQVPIPSTISVPLKEEFDETQCQRDLGRMGAAEFVVKGDHGYQGKRICFAESIKEAIDAVRKFRAENDGAVIQEKVPTLRERSSLCVTVLDGELVGVLNHPLIKEQKDIPLRDLLTDAQIEVAVAAAKAAEQRLAGVDLGGEPDRPVVLETNEAPSFVAHEYYGQKIAAGTAENFISEIREANKGQKIAV